MRKLLSAIIAIAILLPILGAPVSAHGNQACFDGSKVSGLISGDRRSSSATYSGTGVFAAIDPHFDPCGDDDSLVAAWIALVPKNNAGVSVIVQVGVMYCGKGGIGAPSVCNDFPNQFRYFYAYGGCSLVTKYVRDMGPAAYGWHDYLIEYKNGGYYVTSPGGSVYIDDDNVAVSCFKGANLDEQWAVEKFDRGDSSGGLSTQTVIGNMQYRLKPNNYFSHTSWPSSNCHKVMSTPGHTSYCVTGADWIKAWD